MKNYKLVAIAAVSLDGVIGIDNDIPWIIPEDFKHFRKTTMGHTLIVGYNTYLTLPEKAFEGREYYVLKGDNTLVSDRSNVHQFESIEELLGFIEISTMDEFKTFYVVGGSMVYNALIKRCDEAIITWVNEILKRGTGEYKFFPITALFEGFETLAETMWLKSTTGTTYKITNYKKQLNEIQTSHVPRNSAENEVNYHC